MLRPKETDLIYEGIATDAMNIRYPGRHSLKKLT